MEKIMEKSRKICQSRKVGTMINLAFMFQKGSHSTWKTWKNESTPGKPGNIMEFWKN